MNERFYAVRKAATKVIGSRTMTRAEAEREVTAWRAEIGPAVVVAATPELRRAVRRYDQTVLSAVLSTGA